MIKGAIGKKASRVVSGTFIIPRVVSGASQGKVIRQPPPRFRRDNGRQHLTVCLNLPITIHLPTIPNQVQRHLLNLKLNYFRMMTGAIGQLALRQGSGTSMSMMAGIRPTNIRGQGASSLNLLIPPNRHPKIQKLSRAALTRYPGKGPILDLLSPPRNLIRPPHKPMNRLLINNLGQGMLTPCPRLANPAQGACLPPPVPPANLGVGSILMVSNG